MKPTNKLERHGVAHRRQPRGSNGADQKIRGGQNEICNRKRAAKSQPVGCGSAKDGEKPHHAAEDSREGSGLLGGEIKLLLQIKGERSKSPVVGKALENLAELAIQKGRSNPVRISCKRSEKLKSGSLEDVRVHETLPIAQS